jgi:nucleoid-associated protein YgaU
VTVKPGDTLWAIAAGHLPSDATDAEIDIAWRAWYAANDELIGADPDLIIPGQHLLPGNSETRPSP